MKLTLLVILLLLFAKFTSYSKKSIRVEVIATGVNTNLRGMSISSDNVIWVSGSNGMIGKSGDRGKTWNWMIVPGFEKRDFRDIQAFDRNTAVAMAVDNPAIIVKTSDGGITWKKVFERSREGMFLDAMDFKNKKEGICVGDPLSTGNLTEKKFYIIRTSDGGDTWNEVPSNLMPPAEPGEAIFAASGTNISFFDTPDFEYGFVSGGIVSNLYLIPGEGRPSKKIAIPIAQGRETKGTFSMATDRHRNIYCVGGDYKNPGENFINFCYTTNGGFSWDSAKRSSPSGYRSCISLINNKRAVACGPTGIDFAVNLPSKWITVSTESFNVCSANKRNEVFLAGEKGKIGKLVY